MKIERIAKIISNNAKIKENDNICIYARNDSFELCEAIAFEARKTGARPFLSIDSDSYLKNTLSKVPVKFLKKAFPHEVALLRKTDVIIILNLTRGNPKFFESISEKRIGALDIGRMPTINAALAKNKRVIATTIPTAEYANFYGITFKALAEAFLRSIDVDYSLVSDYGKRVAKRLQKAKEIRLISTLGHELKLIKGNRYVGIDDGIARKGKMVNLPCGEVWVAPLEYATEGSVLVKKAIYGDKIVQELEIKFLRGKISAVHAGKGLTSFKNILKYSTGNKSRIGEIGFGINPQATKQTGLPLIDEKIFGSVHIALGDNLFLGGKNKSSLHWDLVITKPTVLLDGNPLLLKGNYILN